MKATNILDQMIDQINPNIEGEKMSFMVDKTIYTNLCKELNRNVKTYKGFKVLPPVDLPYKAILKV